MLPFENETKSSFSTTLPKRRNSSSNTPLLVLEPGDRVELHARARALEKLTHYTSDQDAIVIQTPHSLLPIRVRLHTGKEKRYDRVAPPLADLLLKEKNKKKSADPWTSVASNFSTTKDRTVGSPRKQHRTALDSSFASMSPSSTLCSSAKRENFNYS